MSDWFLLILAIVVVFGGRILAGSLDHDRIRQYIRKAGAKVIDTNRLPYGPGWFGSTERIYEVKYETRDGKMHTATCKTSMFADIYWAGGAPGLLKGNETAAPEPIACLSCGARIPARQTHCPKCGWSYKSG
jgi:hypothetical protein